MLVYQGADDFRQNHPLKTCLMPLVISLVRGNMLGLRLRWVSWSASQGCEFRSAGWVIYEKYWKICIIWYHLPGEKSWRPLDHQQELSHLDLNFLWDLLQSWFLARFLTDFWLQFQFTKLNSIILLQTYIPCRNAQYILEDWCASLPILQQICTAANSTTRVFLQTSLPNIFLWRNSYLPMTKQLSSISEKTSFKNQQAQSSSVPFKTHSSGTGFSRSIDRFTNRVQPTQRFQKEHRGKPTKTYSPVKITDPMLCWK